MRKALSILLVVSLMIAILYFSSQSGGESNGLSFKLATRIMDYLELKGDTTRSLQSVNLIIRKLAHFTEYLLIAVLLATVLKNKLGRAVLAVPLAGLIGVGFAFCDEWVQSGSPGRTQSVFDVMVDGAGVFVGLVAFSIVMIGVRRTKR